MSSSGSAVPKRGRRARLRDLLSPRSELRSSSWDAPPASFQAVGTLEELPARVERGTGAAWLVPSFELLEELVRRGADSSRIAVDNSNQTQQWIDSLVVAGPVDPLLPPTPFAFRGRTLVILPTYNEAENIADMVEAIGRYIAVDILVVDDNSPDGTGKIADGLADKLAHVHVIHRAAKQGLGPAYLAGFAWGLERGYTRLAEMDSDFSHAPWDLPRLIAASKDANLVIGSRYVAGGNTVGWTLSRRLLSRGANLYTKLCLGFRVRDWTAGFRCFHAETLRSLDLDRVAASGYAFQIEMAWRVLRSGGSIRELPVGFVDRSVGNSKMSRSIALEAVRLVPTLRWKK